MWYNNIFLYRICDAELELQSDSESECMFKDEEFGIPMVPIPSHVCRKCQVLLSLLASKAESYSVVLF